MAHDFLKITNKQLEQLIVDICEQANITGADYEKVCKLSEWLHNSIINANLVSMLVEGKIQVSDVDNEGVRFIMSNQANHKSNSPVTHNSDAKIWQEIAEIISEKDKNFPN